MFKLHNIKGVDFFMNIKRVLAELLKKVSDSMITLAPASYCATGVEEMPESMKKLR